MTQRERQVLQLIEKNPLISQQQIADALGITRSSAAVHISNLSRKGLIAGRGYVLRSGSYAVVVGGVNVDIGGRSFEPLVAADSNPGRVTTSLGGVGRNIAHNLCLLGEQVSMVTVPASCSELGIDLSHALRTSEAPTSTYVYLADNLGEMALAVSDMSVCERITPAYLASQLPLLQNAQVVVADTNAPKESLEFLAQNCNVPLFVDPVSTAKAEKIRDILPKIHTLKPNALEAALLTGVEIHNTEDAKKAAKKLLSMGVHRVFISMGSSGVCAARGEECVVLPPVQGNRINTTGCGDAFMAALTWAYLEGMDLEHTALAGLAAGSIAMESSETINPALCAAAVKKRMEQR